MFQRYGIGICLCSVLSTEDSILEVMLSIEDTEYVERFLVKTVMMAHKSETMYQKHRIYS